MTEKRIALYQGTVTDCSYLPDRESMNIYADPHHPDQTTLYNQLIAQGFRRSGEFIYKPGCEGCNACVSTRIVCGDFSPRRSERRNLKRNDDLEVKFLPAKYSDEYFDLYKRYIAARHTDGGMDDPAPEDFERFLLKPWGDTLFVELSLNDVVISVAVTDATTDGLSAVYTFFDPELSQRALGRFSILKQIELCQAMNLPYLYLGYWVDGCQKMQYKTDYSPQEHFVKGEWVAWEAPE